MARRDSGSRRRRFAGAGLAHRVRIEAHVVWLAVRDPRTPWSARLLGVLIAAYALSPLDLIPDFIPVLGLLDEAILIPAAIWLFERLVPPALLVEHRATAEAAAQRPVSYMGVVLVLGIWIAAAGLGWSVIAVLWN